MSNNNFRRRKSDPRSAQLGGFGKGLRREGAGNTLVGVQEPFVNPGGRIGDANVIDEAVAVIEPVAKQAFPREKVETMSRGELASALESLAMKAASEHGFKLQASDLRDIVTVLINDTLEGTPGASPAPEQPAKSESRADKKAETKADAKEEDAKAPEAEISKGARETLEAAKDRIQPLLMEQIDVGKASELSRQELAEQIGEIVGDLLATERLGLNLREQRDLVTMLLNDMLGLGPLEPLLADPAVTDIMVNGPDQIYIERKGKLEVSDVTFRDHRHLMNVCTRIVSQVGRRIDESSPLCDARLADGSRVNIIIPPLAIDGASISIRKFAKQGITLDIMAKQGNVSPSMATVLRIASACRLNILISGGTGSGKTTMLNAMSQMIDHGERIVTIEDSAELQLQQPHVVRLETRPANLEGQGEITMRDLVKNALRMRPDRVVLGEIRSSEAIDVLQAMNTGHDGSMTTIHANTPRDCLMRLENLVGMAGINLPTKAVRTQIASAVDLIIQVSRMRDGIRRVQYITEVVGMEGDVITTQDLFKYKFTGEDANGKLVGTWENSGVRPHFTPRAEYFGLDRSLLECME
jgi:pilus assembly protein CpaF